MNEYRRVLGNRKNLLIVLMCVCMIGGLFYRSTGQDSTYDYYGKLEIYKTMPYEDALAEADSSGEEELAAQLRYLLEYPDFLRRIQEEAESMRNGGLFQEKAAKNIEKTARDYRRMEGQVLTLDSDRVWNAFYQESLEAYGLMLMMLICAMLLTEEKRLGMECLLRAYSGGRRKLAERRGILLIVYSALLVLAVYGSKFVSCCFIYGEMPDMARLAQSIALFKNLSVPLSTGEVLLLYLLTKWIGALFAGSVFWMMLLVFSELSIGIALGTVAVLIEYGLYMGISVNSLWAPLRYVNIFACVDTVGFFTQYVNLKVGSGLVQAGSCAVVTMLILSVLLIIGCILRSSIHSTRRLVPRKANQLGGMLFCPGGRFVNELYKILVSQKGILVLLILVLIRWNYFELPQKIQTGEDRCVEQYYSQFQGRITQSTLKQLEGKKAELEHNHEELLQRLQTDPQSQQLQQEMHECQIRISAIMTVQTEAREKLEREQEQGIEAYLLPQAGYGCVLDPEIAREFQYGEILLVLTFLIVLISGGGAWENQRNMVLLLRSAPAGRKRLIRDKMQAASVLACLLWIMIYGTQLHAYWRQGTFIFTQVPIQNIGFMSATPWVIPIGVYITIVYGIRFILLLCISWMLMWFSLHCARKEWALGGGLLWLAWMFGISTFPYISIFPAIEWVQIYIDHGTEAILCFAVWTVLGGLALGTAGRYWSQRGR